MAPSFFFNASLFALSLVSVYGGVLTKIHCKDEKCSVGCQAVEQTRETFDGECKKVGKYWERKVCGCNGQCYTNAIYDNAECKEPAFTRFTSGECYERASDNTDWKSMHYRCTDGKYGNSLDAGNEGNGNNGQAIWIALISSMFLCVSIGGFWICRKRYCQRANDEDCELAQTSKLLNA